MIPHSRSYLKSLCVSPTLIKLGFSNLILVSSISLPLFSTQLYEYLSAICILIRNCKSIGEFQVLWRLNVLLFFSLTHINWNWFTYQVLSPQAMFPMSQANLLANKRIKFMSSTHISKESKESVNFHCGQFPIEMTGVSAFVPSPSCLKLLVVRNSEKWISYPIWDMEFVSGREGVPHSAESSCLYIRWLMVHCLTFFGLMLRTSASEVEDMIRLYL